MLLRKIKINNIRSYTSEEIEFPIGSTLLSGDIGSGKTSILLAIEFALFGLQPGQRGSSLLKNGENTGGVIIDFVVDGKEITIERNLKRGKSISQDYCAIIIDGEKSEISVTELKDKILDLLEYPKEFAKKQNLLYKFTVNTPQEEMTQIILEDSEVRINTLRHVFGIDKYKKILENLSLLIVKIREEKRIKQALTANLEQDKLGLISKENELETKHYNLVSVEKELFIKTEARKEVEEEKQSIIAKVEEKKDLAKEIDKAHLVLSSKKDLIAENNKATGRIKEAIREIESIKFDENQISENELLITKLKKEKREYSEKNLNITSKISSLNLKNQESESTREKLKRLELCPTCLQDVDPNYKANVFNKLDSDISKNVKLIEELTIEKKEVGDRISKLDYEITMREKELQDLKIMKIRVQEIAERKKRLEEIKNSNVLLERDIDLLTGQIESLKRIVFELSRYDNLFEDIKKRVELAFTEERMADIKVAELKKEIEVFSKQIEETKNRLEKTNILKKEMDYLISLESWLTKNFAAMISFVEKNVMVKLKVEFSKLFNEWFLMLVSENFNAKLRDDFTPVIEQQDYEIDYAYLSGGERTAVALAYRLALNQVINSILSKIKTRDFMILDEPTDGFSDAQLDKMREVLDQLNVGQLIIVSHEQKIEGFVDNVVKLRKLNGISGKSIKNE